MNVALRAAMIGLVLVNLAFVHLTQAASWTWLLPLAALSIASPVLVRYTRFMLYRLVWNLGVLGVFGLLVHHFTSTGVRFLLEDGLLLAALCQVHLLNNVGSHQKPDLLFFNSFLIAVVTSFLSLDLGYSAIFLIYAPLFVIALQLLALDRAGVEATPRLLLRTVGQGLWRGGIALGLTLLVFFFFPRDFQRKGLLGDRIKFKPPGGLMEAGFTDQVELDRSGSVVASDRVVMRVTLEGGNQADVPLHWRGATLVRFDGKRWKPARSSFDPPWRRTRKMLVRNGKGATTQVSVALADTGAQRLFLPGTAQSVRVMSSARVPQPLPDGSVRCTESAAKLLYRVGIRPNRRARGGKAIQLPAFLDMPWGVIPLSVYEQAKAVRATLPTRVDQHRIVEAMRAYLFSNYRYLSPGADGGARSLGDLLDKKKGAHCEIFATALVMMLRSQQVPARLVTGYRSAEWNEAGGVLTFRARHAHAWVEVYDPRAGWYTVDPTPAGDPAAELAAAGWTRRLTVWAGGLWVKVTGFNARARDAAYEWLRALPGRMGRFVRANPFATAGMLALLIAGAWWTRRQRRRRDNPAVAAYRACLRRFKLTPEDGETPRELLARVEIDAAQKRELAAATVAHERSRYAR